MDFQILLSLAEDFEGDIVLALSVRPSFSFCLSGPPAMDYGKLTKGALRSHLPLTLVVYYLLIFIGYYTLTGQPHI